MQIQTVSSNYQARSQGIQRNQKQNNPSFCAHILFARPTEIKTLEDSIEKMVSESNNNTTRNFLIRTRDFLVETLRNIAAHTLKPESHVLYNRTCTIPVDGISFRHSDSIVFDSVHPSTTPEILGYAAEHPEDISMLIETVSGAKVEVPFNATSEELAKIGERIQSAAMSKREQLIPTNTTREYLKIIQNGPNSQPIQNSNLYND